jgi:hypothetical protein
MASPYSLLLKLVYLKAAWSAFAELRKQSRPPPPFVIFGFVDRTLSTVEETLAQQGNNLHELIRWSVRLRRALRRLGDIENLPLGESTHALCLLTRVHVLLGHFDDVVPFLPRIWDDRPHEEAYHLGHQELNMIETVLQDLARNRSPVAVLDFHRLSMAYT